MRFQYSQEDQMFPVYCIACGLHIPKQVSNANKGLCPDCLTKSQRPVPPPQVPPQPPPYHQPPQQFVPPPPMQGGYPPPNVQYAQPARKNNVALFALLGVAGLCGICLLGSFLSGNKEEDDPPAASNDPPAVSTERPVQDVPDVTKSRITPEYEQRWATVTKVFTDLGCYVDPMDPSFPYTMRAYVPSQLAMEITPQQAREIAGLARSRLHEDAIVYIKSEGGQTLAKAAPWGIE